MTIKFPRSVWIAAIASAIVSGVLLWQAALPFIAERHFREGYNYFVHKRYELAVDEYQKAVNAAPWDSHYYIYLAQGYTVLFQDKSRPKAQRLVYLDKIRDTLLKLVELDNLSPWYRSRLAQHMLDRIALYPEKQAELLAKSGELFELAHNLDPNNALFVRSLAQFHHLHGDKNKAITLYERVLEIDSAPFRFHQVKLNLGQLYMASGNADRAIEVFKMLYDHNPVLHNAASILGRIYFEKGDIQNAFLYFNAYYKIAPRKIDAIQNLAEFYFLIDEKRKAKTLYEKLLKRDPGNALATQRLNAIAGASD